MKESKCIVVSGCSCAGSTSIGRYLATRLAFEFFSVGEFVRNTMVRMGDYGIQQGYSSGGILLLEKTQLQIDQDQVRVAGKGNVVIDSKLGLFLLKDQLGFGVWLHAKEETRAIRLSERSGLSYHDAISSLRERETSENEIWKRLYGVDVHSRGSERANLSLDTTSLSIDECVTLIESVLNK